jgi:hypothetical protein
MKRLGHCGWAFVLTAGLAVGAGDSGKKNG